MLTVPPTALAAGNDYRGGGDGAIFFTKNGRFLGIAFRRVDVKACIRKRQTISCFLSLFSETAPSVWPCRADRLLSPCAADPRLPDSRPRRTERAQRPLYPVIGLDSHCLVTANFGAKPFAFDVPAFESWFTGTKLNCYAPSAREEQQDEVSPFDGLAAAPALCLLSAPALFSP